MAVTLSLSYTLNSQSVANNTSNVTVTVKATWTGGSYNTLQKSGSLTIDGTKYAFTSSFNTSQTTSGSQTLFSKTVNVPHASNGTKTLQCSASYVTGVSSGTISASFSKALTTIPRASTLSASNGTLGTAQTLTVTKADSSYTHTITYKCGSASGTICTKSSSTSVSFTPPLTLASQNTTGASVSITFTITTFNGSTSIGTATKTITCAIPASVAPSFTVTLSDPTGYRTTYGRYIIGKSKLSASITVTAAYGSSIKEIKATANGETYTTQSFTTGVLKKDASVDIVVKDGRGRQATYVTWEMTYSYTAPVIERLTVKRCNADGTENAQGEYVQATFSAKTTTFGEAAGLEKNKATYTIRYKKTTESQYTEVNPFGAGVSIAGNASNETYIFAADSSSSYNVELWVADDFETTKRATSASTAFTLMHWGADGTSLGIGKLAEESDLLDIGLPTRFNKPVYGKVLGMDRLPAIPSGSDLNDYMEPGCYAIQSNAIAESCANIPVARAGRLEVWSATGEGIRVEQWSYIRQRFVPYNSSNAVWERDVTRGQDNVWNYYEWWRSTLTPAVSEKIYSKSAMTCGLSADKTSFSTNIYTRVPLTQLHHSIGNKLAFTNNMIKVVGNVENIKVSGQVLIACAGSTNNRHIRIRKIASNGTTPTNIAWSCLYCTASRNEVFSFAPMIIPVSVGEFIDIAIYTPSSTDSVQAGSSGNGTQTWLTVEEL